MCGLIGIEKKDSALNVTLLHEFRISCILGWRKREKNKEVRRKDYKVRVSTESTKKHFSSVKYFCFMSILSSYPTMTLIRLFYEKELSNSSPRAAEDEHASEGSGEFTVVLQYERLSPESFRMSESGKPLVYFNATLWLFEKFKIIKFFFF